MLVPQDNENIFSSENESENVDMFEYLQDRVKIESRVSAIPYFVTAANYFVNPNHL